MTIDNVQDITPRRQYVATAGQTVFAYPFPIFADADLVVVVKSTTKVLTTDYTVSGSGTNTGGNVTLLVGCTAGDIVTIYRNIAVARSTNFQQNGPLNSATFNTELDRVVLMVQQIEEAVNRALRIPTTANVIDSDISLDPTNWASKYMTFDVNGKPTPAALSSTAMTQAIIGGLLNPRTQAEITAGIVPTNFSYPTLNVLRYANAVGNGIADDHVAVQAAFTVAGVAGGTVIFPAGYVFLCSADITVPVASGGSGSGNPVASAQGPGWATISVIFGTGATFGFVILGTGATTGGVQGSTYNYAGTFRDLGIQLNGTSKNAFYVNSVNQPHIDTCWIRGSGTNGCGAYFLNCLVPVFEDTLVTGCGSATQYSVEFDTCTTASWRGSRISGGVVTKGGLAIDRCTNFLIDGISSESSGTPIVISGKAEATLANTTITMRGLELENPGAGNPYIDIGAGLSGSALVVDVLLDGMYGSPSGTATVPYGVRIQNTTGFEAKGCHFTLGSAPTSCFELTGTNLSGIFIRTHRNLQTLGIPWVRYNGSQVLAAGPHAEWQLGLFQAGKPIAMNKGLAGIYDGANLTGATPSILISSTMGGYYSSKAVTNGGATTVTSLSGGEPGMEVTLVAGDGNTTLTNGNSGGAFRLIAGVNLLMVAGRPYKFFNDGSNGGAGSCWCQLS